MDRPITRHVIDPGTAFGTEGVRTYCGRIGYPTEWPYDYDTKKGKRLIALPWLSCSTCKTCLRAAVRHATKALKALEDHNKELERSK